MSKIEVSMEMLGPLTIPSIIFMVIVGIISWIVIKITELETAKLDTHPISEAQESNVVSRSKGHQIDEVKVIYGTTTGKAKSFAANLTSKVKALGLKVTLVNARDYDVEQDLPSEEATVLVVVVVSTYSEGRPPEEAKWFYEYVKEAAGDFRTQHSILKVREFAMRVH